MKKAIFISCFGWYERRIKPIAEILENRDYKVTVLVADFDQLRHSKMTDKNAECTYIEVPAYSKNISVQRIFSHLEFGRKVNKYLNSLKPDLVYLLMPPNNTARYCIKYINKYPDTKYIVDLIDLWPESMPLGKLKKSLPCKVWKSWRNKSVKCADHVFAECDFYRDELKSVIGNSDRASTLHLFKEQNKEEQDFISSNIETWQRINREDINNKKIVLGYVGSINNIIDIDGITSLVQDFIKSGYKVNFHIIGDGESKDNFISSLNNVGAEVIYYGKIFGELEKIKILGPCNFGINMMKSSVAVGLSIKSIDYFSYGLPVINNIKGDTWSLLEQNVIGFNYSNQKSILNFLDNKLVRKDVLKIYSENFTRRVFADEVKKQLEGLI
jgi:glycosyltransferase involved in cell wall biosynthesis